jgi:ABC-type multidrug transport system fused ATPase/permease subunit
MTSNFIQGSSFGFSGENLTLRIRSMSYAAILRQDISFFDEEKHSVGALTSALSLDATQVNGLAGITLGTILQVCVTLLSGLIVALVVGQCKFSKDGSLFQKIFFKKKIFFHVQYRLETGTRLFGLYSFASWFRCASNEDAEWFPTEKQRSL